MEIQDTPVPLHRHPAIRTRDPDELRRFLSPLYAITGLSLLDGNHGIDSRINHIELSSCALSFGEYGGPVRLSIAQGEFFAQGFPLSGAGRAIWDRSDHQVSPRRLGIIVNPGSGGTLEYGEGFRHLVVRIDPHALRRKAAALAGYAADVPLRFFHEGAYDPRYGMTQFRMIQYLVQELDQNTAFPRLFLDEMEQMIMVGVLYASEHTYSRYLQAETRATAPWQARQAAEYIEAHWSSPLTIEALAGVCNVSTRSLFQIFRRTYGVSPMVFVRNIRLHRAQEMLRMGGPGISVTSVCYLCGFSNLGRFSRDYMRTFGEFPSQTLRTRQRA